MSRKAVMKRIIELTGELLFPSSLYCVCCGNIIDESRSYSLCDHCMEHFRWVREAYELRKGMKLIRCVQYGIYERSIIFDLKYRGKKYLARIIAEIMRDKLEASNMHIDYIVPVPLHNEKLKTRGFNQAELIADFLSPLIGAKTVNCLKRVKPTIPMRGLNEEERRENIRGSIKLDSEDAFAGGGTIAILDDFYTTGSTAQECAEALKAVDSEEIVFIAFASR